MFLGYVHIMMFYGNPENVSLTHSIKFITKALVLVNRATQENFIRSQAKPKRHFRNTFFQPSFFAKKELSVLNHFYPF